MKNVNYNLIKSLHNVLDDMWRLEKFYVRDSKKAKCHSQKCMKDMLDTRKMEAKQLIQEIEKRIKDKKFD